MCCSILCLLVEIITIGRFFTSELTTHCWMLCSHWIPDLWPMWTVCRAVCVTRCLILCSRLLWIALITVGSIHFIVFERLQVSFLQILLLLMTCWEWKQNYWLMLCPDACFLLWLIYQTKNICWTDVVSQKKKKRLLSDYSVPLW